MFVKRLLSEILRSKGDPINEPLRDDLRGYAVMRVRTTTPVQETPARRFWVSIVTQKQVNTIIKAARERRNLDQDEIAATLGLSVMSYYHIEVDSHGFVTLLDLRVVKQLCRELDIDINALLDLPPTRQSTGSLPGDRAAVLKARRIEIGMSTEQLSDLVGTVESAITDAEHDNNALESWSIEFGSP